MRLRFLVIPPLSVLILPAVLAAQVPGYPRASTDTVRYREITSSSMEMMLPQGPARSHTQHDATIALTFPRPDQATAWYEALSLRDVSGTEERVPTTAAVLGKPFTLDFPVTGHVRTISTPEFPASFDGITNLRHQFDDFFLRLPSKPLQRGLTWSDTTEQTDSIMPRDSLYRGGKSVTRRVGQYRVVGDTVMGGVAASVVDAEIVNTMRSVVQGPTEELKMISTLEGIDRSRFYFAAGRGLIERRRSAELNGGVEYMGGPQPVTLPLKMTYQSTIQLVQ